MKENVSYKPLISNWEDYLKESKTPSIEGFARYILSKGKGKKTQEEYWMNSDMQGYFDENTSKFSFQFQSPEAATLIWRLHKFIRIYTRPILLQMGLASNDEFAILATVDARKECPKKAAINENLIELTTGIDMIKRLVNQGLLSEKTNKKDKREKLISLSSKGKKLFYSIFEKFAGVQDVLGELNQEERQILVKFLKTLDVYHTKIVQPEL